MFRIKTTDTSKLKRIVIGGAGAILTGFVLLAINLLGPLFGGASYSTGNIVFTLFGVLTVVFAAHPTYQAAEKLDAE